MAQDEIKAHGATLLQALWTMQMSREHNEKSMSGSSLVCPHVSAVAERTWIKKLLSGSIKVVVTSGSMQSDWNCITSIFT